MYIFYKKAAINASIIMKNLAQVILYSIYLIYTYVYMYIYTYI